MMQCLKTFPFCFKQLLSTQVSSKSGQQSSNAFDGFSNASKEAQIQSAINFQKKNYQKIILETIARHEASQKQPPGVKQSGSLSEQH